MVKQCGFCATKHMLDAISCYMHGVATPAERPFVANSSILDAITFTKEAATAGFESPVSVDELRAFQQRVDAAILRRGLVLPPDSGRGSVDDLPFGQGALWGLTMRIDKALVEGEYQPSS